MAPYITRKDFRSAVLKIERAYHHINELEAIVRSYVATNVKSLNPKGKRNLREGRVVGGKLPKHANTIVGDVIHNLRTSLDHAYCALVEANGSTVNRRVIFPFADTKLNAAASLNGHKMAGIAPSDDVIALILDEIKPFEIAGSELYGLNRLDIADKHHALIGAESAMPIDRLTIRNQDGSLGPTISGVTLVTPDGDQGGTIAIKPGSAIELKGNPYAAFQICFKQGEPFEGESILDTLKRLAKLTGHTIEALSKV
jgi:hypothetical protein